MIPLDLLRFLNTLFIHFIHEQGGAGSVPPGAGVPPPRRVRGAPHQHHQVLRGHQRQFLRRLHRLRLWARHQVGQILRVT